MKKFIPAVLLSLAMFAPVFAEPTNSMKETTKPARAMATKKAHKAHRVAVQHKSKVNTASAMKKHS